MKLLIILSLISFTVHWVALDAVILTIDSCEMTTILFEKNISFVWYFYKKEIETLLLFGSWTVSLLLRR